MPKPVQSVRLIGVKVIFQVLRRDQQETVVSDGLRGIHGLAHPRTRIDSPGGCDSNVHRVWVVNVLLMQLIAQGL